MTRYDDGLDHAIEHAKRYLVSLPDRPVWPVQEYRQLLAALRAPLQDEPCPVPEVIDQLAAWAEPGLASNGSPRFFGFVNGGTQPAALGADWLATAWDQNAGLRAMAPAAAAAETVAAEWLLDLLDLPRDSSVGFVTGATMANFTGLAAARQAVLARAGYDVERLGLVGCPPVRVLVGADRHLSVAVALRYLGIGTDSIVPVATDDLGRIDVADLVARLDEGSGPTILCLQAGEVHTGAFDPFPEAVPAAHRAGAWVHVDGAFGLWARAGDTTRHLAAGVELADSWCTDCHKTLNVPYDSGLAIVRDPAAHAAAFATRADYLRVGRAPDGSASGQPPGRPELEPADTVPEMSRRARGFAVWAALRAMGRSGVAALVDRLHARAQRMAAGLAGIEGVRVLGDVGFTQLMADFGDPDLTAEVGDRLLSGGVAAITPSTWRGTAVQRISISNWSTSEEDVDRTVAELAGLAGRPATER